MERLKQSTETYIKTRKPHFSSGKIRKAMILQIHDKVVAELTKYASAAQETATKEAYTTYNDAMASYKAMSKEKTPKGVASVCKALQDHVNVVSQVLQGTLALTKKQEKTLDDHLNRIIELVAEHEVEDNQSPCLSTRFFNALGWAQKKPVLTNADGLRRAVASSPIPKIMYHTIQAIGNPPEALPFGEQLAGSGPISIPSSLMLKNCLDNRRVGIGRKPARRGKTCVIRT